MMAPFTCIDIFLHLISIFLVNCSKMLIQHSKSTPDWSLISFIIFFYNTIQWWMIMLVICHYFWATEHGEPYIEGLQFNSFVKPSELKLKTCIAITSQLYLLFTVMIYRVIWQFSLLIVLFHLSLFINSGFRIERGCLAWICACCTRSL